MWSWANNLINILSISFIKVFLDIICWSAVACDSAVKSVVAVSALTSGSWRRRGAMKGVSVAMRTCKLFAALFCCLLSSAVKDRNSRILKFPGCFNIQYWLAAKFRSLQMTRLNIASCCQENSFSPFFSVLFCKLISIFKVQVFFEKLHSLTSNYWLKLCITCCYLVWRRCNRVWQNKQTLLSVRLVKETD